ncbi:MAG: hypothetical protein L0241_28305, partial [Planctomycetia bacterium]|nr:hypothetical protein [Planctomycetia bacterium]
MRWIPAGLVIALVAFPFPMLVAHSPIEPPKKPLPTIDELVADLGHPVYAVREKTQRDLWARGSAAIPALQKAAKGDDPEVVRRARELLDKFAWGIFPDTPPAVLKLIRQFQVGDERPEKADELRQQAVIELLKLGKPGLSAVRAILAKDLNPESRAKLTAHVTKLVRREVPLKLVDGKLAEATELIELHALGTTDDGAADFAAFHTLNGTLPAAIARAEDALKTSRRPENAKLVLVYLYRAAGQWAKARAVADDLPNPPEEITYEELLLEDEGNWGELADLSPGRALNHPDAVRLIHLRLAGQRDKFLEEAKKVRASAEGLTTNTDVRDSAIALLAAQRADDATNLLLDKKMNLGLLSEILITRMRYKEALDLIGAEKNDKRTIPPGERLEFNLRRARVLLMTGHKDDAVQQFEEVARGLRTPDRGGGFDLSARSLVRTELRVGLRDLACEHGALFIPPNAEGRDGGPRGESVFELIFPNDAVVADALFAVLRAAKVPGNSPGATMLRVRDILAGTAGKAAVDQAVKLLRASAASLPNAGPPTPSGSPRLMKARRYLALATICRIAKRQDEANDAFEIAEELAASTEDTGNA